MANLTLSDAEFDSLRELIVARSGISIGDSKRYLIETRLSRLVTDEGCDSFASLIERLGADADSPLVDQVVDAMTTNETLWFRDDGPWALLRGPLLSRLCDDLEAKRRTRIRIWSAACATGQEPYSIAMTILEYLEERGGSAKADSFQVVASDLSPSALFVAKSGRYDKLAIERGLAPELREKYFEQQENTWSIAPELRAMVRLERRNLMEPLTDLGQFDVVFCRNVMIYFSTQTKRDLVERIHGVLPVGGALLVGAAESLQGAMSLFDLKQADGHFFYEKRGEGR